MLLALLLAVAGPVSEPPETTSRHHGFSGDAAMWLGTTSSNRPRSLAISA